MGYILSQLQGPKAITNSIRWDEYIVLVRNNVIDIVTVDEDVELKHQLVFDEGVIACQTMQTKLVVLSGNTIYSIEKDTWSNSIISKLDANGQLQAIDGKSFIIANSSYLILYHFQGILDFLTINDSSTGRGKKRKLNESLVSLSIGAIVVVDMVAMANHHLAMLYRDFNFNYSLRFYKINFVLHSVSIAKQFEQFDEPPHCVIPIEQGGILVVSNLHIFYFPSIDQKLELSGFDDSISINYKESIVTKKISLDVDESIKTFEFIDDSRILIISLTGNTYIIDFIATFNSKSVQIHNITLTKLGLSTIPINVHMISEDLFLATSRLPQSVLFQVLPNQPFIHIVKFIESSPPVLDIGYKRKFDQLSIYTCQGGYHSGEFKKYGSNILDLKLKQTIPAPGANKLVMMDNNTILIQKPNINEITVLDENDFTTSDLHAQSEILDIKIKDNNQIFVTANGIFRNGDAVVTCEIEFSRILQNGCILFVDANRKIVLHDGVSEIHSSELNMKHISAIETISTEDKHYALVTNWDGEYKLYSFSRTKLTLILEKSLEKTMAVISSGLICHNGILYIVLLTDVGITQIPVNLKTNKVEEYKIKTSKLTELPLKIIKNANMICMYNRHEIFGMKLDSTLKMLVPFTVDETKQDIEDIVLLDNKIVILLNMQLLQVMELKFAVTESLFRVQTIYSRSLYLKLLNIPNSKFSVAISRLFLMDDQSSKVTIQSRLELINNAKMKVVNSYDFDKGINVMDLCLIPEFEDDGSVDIPRNSFVVLSSGNKTPLSIFSIQKSKLVMVKISNIEGISEVESLDFQSISLQDENDLLFFISGSSNFTVELQIERDIPKWKIIPTTISSLLVHCIAHVCTPENVIIGDLRQGLLVGNLNDEKMKLTKVPTEYPHQYLTSIDCDTDEMDQLEIISGDSFGNISVLGNEYEQKLAFNIGEQVNVIKTIEGGSYVIGTVNGGIYLLMKIPQEKFAILEKCSKELDSISKRYNENNRSWRLANKDIEGNFTKIKPTGIIDMRLVREYLLSKPPGKKISNKNISLLELMCFV